MFRLLWYNEQSVKHQLDDMIIFVWGAQKIYILVNILSFMESLCGLHEVTYVHLNGNEKIFQWEHILATVFIYLMIHDVLVFVRPF